MSSLDGLEILKNWQRAEVIVKTLLGTVSMAEGPKEVSVKVLSFTGSDLVLDVSGSGETISFDVRGATFSAGRRGNLLVVDINTPSTKITIYEYKSASPC